MAAFCGVAELSFLQKVGIESLRNFTMHPGHQLNEVPCSQLCLVAWNG